MAEAEPPKSDPPEYENEERKRQRKFTQNLYQNTDLGPFEVFVQGKDKNVGNYHILSLAREIYGLKIKDILKFNKKGKNRIGITFSNYLSANQFVMSNILENKGYETFIPANNVTCKGIVRYVDKDLTEEEIRRFSDANLAFTKIINVKRLNRRVVDKDSVNYIPTGTVLFTFSGKIIPQEILIYNLPMKVTPYISPVIQCGNCLIYGHSNAQCKSKKKCRKCGISHEEQTKCTQACLHCKSPSHTSMDRECPEYGRQKEIKLLMSFENITYYEACQQIKKPIHQDCPNIKAFPQLNPSQLQSNSTTVNQRRNTVINESFHQLKYSSAVKSPTQNKKRKLPETGYNQSDHNNLLINSNGRLPQFTSHNPLKEITPPFNSKQLQIDFVKALSTLSDQHKELVMNFIGNLLNKSQTYNHNSNILRLQPSTSQKNNVSQQLSFDESEDDTY